MWEDLKYELGGAWTDLKRSLCRVWGMLSKEPIPTLLQVVPAVLMAITSYYSLEAAKKANETSEQAYRSSTQAVVISRSSQRLAEEVAGRERLSGRADLLASMEEERCWRVQDGKVLCSTSFTLTNAGKYAAENIAVYIAHHNLFGQQVRMKLSGDLPGGQHQQFATEPYPYEKRFSAQESVILAVAYRDKELALCPNKSWAFQAAAGATEWTLVKLIGAAVTTSSSWAEDGAANASSRKDCREMSKDG